MCHVIYLSVSGMTAKNMYWKRKANITSQDLINETGPASSFLSAKFIQAIDKNALISPETSRNSSHCFGIILVISSNTRNSGNEITKPQPPRNRVINK